MERNKKLGAWGEAAAKSYLLGKGYLLLEANYRTGRGEIDLIFKKGGWLIFVEVKTRRESLEDPAEIPLSLAQSKNLQRTMLAYAIKKRADLDALRLDLIVITLNRNRNRARLRHYRDVLI